MKKITDLKKLLCLSVSTATFLSIGCIAMADESEEITEDVPEGTEVIENDYCDEEIIEEYSAEEIIFEDDLYAAEEEFDALTVDEEELPEDLIEDLETIDMEEVSASYTGWKQEYNRWYYYIDGEIYKGGWLQLKGKRYYLSKSSGFMYTGMWDIDDKVYLFDGSGVMQTGWVKYDMDWYYFGSDGAAASGWKTIDNKKYYFDEYECEMYTGSRIINDSWYYFGTDGVLNKGWQQPWGSDGEWSYYGTDGKAVSGWNKIGDHWYYFYQRATFEPPVMVSDQYAKLDGFYYGFDDNGRMIKGWKNFGSESRPTWLYFDSKGKAVRGFNKIGDNWYYFDEDEDSAPVMYRNRMVSIDGSVYRFDGNGAMHTGWYKEGSDKFPTWYYFKSSGKAATGWTEINGKMYYFSQNTNSPSMYMNGIYTIDGESYYFDSNGVMQKNYWYLQSNYNDDYYFGSDGKRVKG